MLCCRRAWTELYRGRGASIRYLQGAQQHDSPSALGFLHRHNTLASNSLEAPHSDCASSPSAHPPGLLSTQHKEHSRSTAHSSRVLLSKASKAPGTHRHHQGQAGPHCGRTPAMTYRWKSGWVWWLHEPPDQSPHLRPGWRNAIAKTQQFVTAERGVGPCLL